jgi:hypothetical protein
VVARHASVLEHPALRAWLAATELCAVVTTILDAYDDPASHHAAQAMGGHPGCALPQAGQ